MIVSGVHIYWNTYRNYYFVIGGSAFNIEVLDVNKWIYRLSDGGQFADLSLIIVGMMIKIMMNILTIGGEADIICYPNPELVGFTSAEFATSLGKAFAIVQIKSRFFFIDIGCLTTRASDHHYYSDGQYQDINLPYFHNVRINIAACPG